MIRIPGTIPITIHPIFWILAGFLAFMSSGGAPIQMVIWMGIIFLSVLIHEFGHALTAKAFGQKSFINLIAFGGVTSRHGPALRGWQEFLIVLNGPLAGLLLALISWSLLPKKTEELNLVRYALLVSTQVNIFWTILNLFPIYPLDGGQLLKIILQGLFGVRGVRIALFLGIILASLLSFFFLLSGNLLGGALFILFSFENYRNWKESRYLTEEDQKEPLWADLKEGEKAFKRGEFETAKVIFQKVRESVNGGTLYLQSSRFLAELLNHEHQYQEAYQILAPLASQLDVQGLRLLHETAFLSGHIPEAIKWGNRTYQEEPYALTALLNALCHASLKEKEPTLGWLESASRQGIPSNGIALLDRQEFDWIRDHPLFKSIYLSCS